MNNVFKAVVLFILFATNATAQVKTVIFTVSNPSGDARVNELIAIPWKEVLAKLPDATKDNFKVVNAITKKELPYQIEYKGLQNPQNLLIQVSVASHGTITLELKKGIPAKVISKVFARYVPERKDDFAWENDRMAFRMYGKAIEGTSEDAYGMDVWTKRTDRLIINERYKKDDYHVDHGDGLDYYHVGLTLGAGNMAPIVNDIIRYSKNYHHWKVLDNGPLRTTFELSFDEWNAGGIPVSVVKTVSLDAGSQLNKIEMIYQYKSANKLQVVAGLVKRPEPGVALLDEPNGILAYWEPQHDIDGITGTAVILENAKIKTVKDQFLAQTEAGNNISLVYYAGAVWNKAGLITTADAWFKYLQTFNRCLKVPLKVGVGFKSKN